jgi:hypothetical protein
MKYFSLSQKLKMIMKGVVVIHANGKNNSPKTTAKKNSINCIENIPLL